MDVQKTMEFILEQQAALSARMVEAEVRHSQTEININQLIEAQYNTEQNLIRIDNQLAESQAKTDEVMRAMGQRVDQLAVRMDNLSENVDSLVGKVDALVDVVDSIARKPN